MAAHTSHHRLHSTAGGSRSRATSPLMASSPFPSQHRDLHSGSSSDTAYNGAEGLIDDRPSVDVERDPYDIPVGTATANSTTPVRPTLGVRFLSTLSTSAQPAASALTRKGSVLHSRAKSLAAFVPKLSPSPSNTSTPERPHSPNKIFGDLFHGESAPIKLGAPTSPTKEREESEFVMDYKPTFTQLPAGSLKRRGTRESQTTIAASPPTTKTTSSWFSRKASSPTAAKSSPTPDELATLNINTSLFPHGPADPLNPAAFNDLLLNATSLLQRMQMAYREKSETLASAQPEMDAQREEVEEAETRSRHLKMQLEDMSRRAQEQDTAMREMANQLMEERVRTQEALEANKTIRLVRRSTGTGKDDGEDEETPRRRKRASGGSGSDSGFESDADAESLLSTGGLSTTLTPPTATLLTSPPDYDGRAWALPTQQKSPRSLNSRENPPRRSDNDNNVVRPSPHAAKRLGSEGAAWATVDTLRAENAGLKRQVEEMRTTLQGCIDFVSILEA